jgi:hypothetical protein
MASKLLVPALLFAFAVCPSLTCHAGSLKGRATSLENENLGIVTITIEPISRGTNIQTQKFESDANGFFNFKLPDGIFVNVTFSRAGRTSARVIGLSGNTVVDPFNVALPELPCAPAPRRCCRLFRR